MDGNMQERLKILKIVVFILIVSIIAAGNILTEKMLFAEKPSTAYTYEAGHPFHALGSNISTNLQQEKPIEIDYKDNILHGDMYIKGYYSSNNGDWSNGRFENYTDVIKFFSRTRLFIDLVLLMLLLLITLITTEFLL